MRPWKDTADTSVTGSVFRMEQGLWHTDAETGIDRSEKISLTRVLITCDDDNVGSARVMEKNGFVFAGKTEHNVDGEPVITRRCRKTIYSSTKNRPMIIS